MHTTTKSETVEATPRPWNTGTNGDKCPKGHAICSGALVIAKVYGNGYPIGEGWAPSSQADADLIVRAVNAHDELVKALTDLLEMLDREDDGAAWRMASVEAKARAALAKVTPS